MACLRTQIEATKNLILKEIEEKQKQVEFANDLIKEAIDDFDYDDLGGNVEKLGAISKDILEAINAYKYLEKFIDETEKLQSNGEIMQII